MNSPFILSDTAVQFRDAMAAGLDPPDVIHAVFGGGQ